MELILSYSHSDDHHRYFDVLYNEKPVRCRQIKENGQIEIHYSDFARACGYNTFGHYLLSQPGCIEELTDLRQNILNEIHHAAQVDL